MKFQVQSSILKITQGTSAFHGHIFKSMNKELNINGQKCMRRLGERMSTMSKEGKNFKREGMIKGMKVRNHWPHSKTLLEFGMTSLCHLDG